MHVDDVRVAPRQFSTGRVIMLHTVRGTMHLPLAEAAEVLIQLTSALERALDPTPLPEPEYVASAPIRGIIASKPLTLDELA